MSDPGRPPLLSMTGITKRYPGTTALDDVGFTIHPGEMVGLLGKNGAGKSTLIKVMAGLETADAGEVAVDGEVRSWGAQAAADAGFDFVFQELEEFADLSVADNVMLGSSLPTTAGFVSERKVRAAAARYLDAVDCRVAPTTPMSELTPVQRRLVMVARALAGNNRLLVLDEPTAALTPREVADVLSLCRRLQAQGTAIIFVSHRLTEVLDLVDRIVVLRDGQHVADRPRSAFDLGSLIETISGHTGVTVTERRAPVSTVGREAGDPVLRVRGLSDGVHFHDIDLDLHAGESLGIGGLVGAGRTELLAALVGDAPTTSGTVEVHGRRVTYRSVVDSLADGMVLLPEERRAQGLIGSQDVKDNTTLSSLRAVRRHRRIPVVSARRERMAVAPLVATMQMKITGLDQEVRTLSGGTQQKVITARALLTGSRIILMDEPTAGIDVEAKEEIYELVDSLKAEGRSVVVVSSDFTELIRMSDRVLVMSGGRSPATLSGDDVTNALITRHSYAFGTATGTPSAGDRT